MLVAAWLKMKKSTTTKPQAGDRTRPGSAGGDRAWPWRAGGSLAQGRPGRERGRAVACARPAPTARRGCGSRGRCGWWPSWGWRPGTRNWPPRRRWWPSWPRPGTRRWRSSAGSACQVRGLAQGDASLLGRAWELLRSSPRPLLRASTALDYGTVLLDRAGRGVTRGRGGPAGRGMGRVRPGRRSGRAAGSGTDAAPGRASTGPSGRRYRRHRCGPHGAGTRSPTPNARWPSW